MNIRGGSFFNLHILFECYVPGYETFSGLLKEDGKRKLLFYFVMCCQCIVFSISVNIYCMLPLLGEINFLILALTLPGIHPLPRERVKTVSVILSRIGLLRGVRGYDYVC